MKHIKIYSLVMLISAVLLFTQSAIAEPTVVIPNTLQLSSDEIQQPKEEEDDKQKDQEDIDGGDDQCELIFPFCEANIIII
ncbi:MAG: hypothetical protein ACK4NN_07605 [Rheinheimera sp.]